LVGSGGRCGRKVETWEVDVDGEMVGGGIANVLDCLAPTALIDGRPPVTSRLGIVQLFLL
jgi:hypothetical protein